MRAPVHTSPGHVSPGHASSSASEMNGAGGDGPIEPSEAIEPEGPRPARSRKRPALSVTQRAIGLLTRREHSRKELVRKLTSRGMEAAEVATAVDRLAREGWQDDARFATSEVSGA